MSIRTPQWTEFLSCPVCFNVFDEDDRKPISLACGHTVSVCQLWFILNSSRFIQSYMRIHLFFVYLCTFLPHAGLSTVSWKVITKKLSVRQRRDISANWWTAGEFCVTATGKIVFFVTAWIISRCFLPFGHCLCIDCCMSDWSCNSGYVLSWC